jgi:predicted cation transporter
VPFPVAANLLILLVVLAGPFLSHKVERNLEGFLFVMGVASALASGALTAHLAGEALRHPLPITGAVLAFGLLFLWARTHVGQAVGWAQARMGPGPLVAVTVVVLGLASSVVTAIIASLVLVEFISALRLPKAAETRIVVLACFAIGLGAALTPVGEPLSTIATAKLRQDFWFLLRLLGAYIAPGVAALALLAGAAGARGSAPSARPGAAVAPAGGATASPAAVEAEAFPVPSLAAPPGEESLRTVVARAARVYVFVVALTLLGEGFRPVIETYVIGLDARILYWINMVSAVLDNATLTAAEVDVRMSPQQVQAVLMGLLVSGGMLIPGNIPNIVAASRLGIGSREWARIAVPIGAAFLVLYYAVLFLL